MRVHDEHDAPSVQFLVDTDTNTDTDTTADAPARTFGRPMLRRALTVAVVIVLGGALVARTATSRDSDHGAVPQPTRSVGPPTDRPLAPFSAVPVQVLPLGRHWAVEGSAHCPAGSVSCTVSAMLPATFLAAVRDHLHVAMPTLQVDVSTGDRMQTWYRELRAAGVGASTIIVTVSKSSGSRGSVSTSTSLTPGSVTAVLIRPTGRTGFSIQIKITGPADWSPPQDAMVALAADPRLIARG